MSWIGTVGPWAWGFVIIAIGIVALYFLKLRRDPIEVSSTYLWGKTIQDLHVNSLLQRMRRSLLLFLQLLMVALAAIAVFRPGIRDDVETQERVVFLLDCSASMQATDLEGGVSRFETAKQLIQGQIETLSDQQTAMLITFSDQAETVQAFTSDRNRLLTALNEVVVTNRTTDIMEAVRAADGLANPRRSSQVGDLNDVQVAEAQPAKMYIYSDGCFPPLSEFNLGNLSPQFVSVGSQQVSNLAITEFSAQRDIDASDRVQVYAKVVNFGTAYRESEVELRMNGELVDAALVSVDPNQEQGLAFELISDEFAVLTLELTAKDDLLIDNLAYAGLTPSKRASVLVVTEGNTALEVGLATEKIELICDVTFVNPEFLTTLDYQKLVIEGRYDLLVFDRCSPTAMPAASTFFIGALPPVDRVETVGFVGRSESEDDLPVAENETISSAREEAGAGVGAENTRIDANDVSTAALEAASGGVLDSNESGSQSWAWSGAVSSLSIIDVNRTHPLLRYLDLYSLLVFSGQPLDLPDNATELIAADIGTVMAIANRNSYQDVVLAFPVLDTDEAGEAVANTNWYAERSWPVFLFNLVRTIGNASESTAALSYRPGDLVRGTLAGLAEGFMVRSMSGRKVDVTLHDQVRYETLDTEELGCYDVTGEGELLERFAVNLFHRPESAIQAKVELELGYENIQAGNVELLVRREYWRLALLVLLIVLVAEWWIYNRRMV